MFVSIRGVWLDAGRNNWLFLHEYVAMIKLPLRVVSYYAITIAISGLFL